MVDFGITFQKITHRGTRVICSKLTLTNWTSDKFKEFQNTRLSSVPSNFIIHVGRGFRTMRICDITKSQSLNIKDHIIVINRGTKTRYL